jgi:hypothetical protein
MQMLILTGSDSGVKHLEHWVSGLLTMDEVEKPSDSEQ